MAVAQLQRRCCCCCCCCCCYCCCCCCCAATCDGEAGAAPLSGARGSDFQGSDVRRAFLLVERATMGTFDTWRTVLYALRPRGLRQALLGSEQPHEAQAHTHTGDQPFACDHEGCGKRFSASGNLTTHKRTIRDSSCGAALQHEHTIQHGRGLDAQGPVRCKKANKYMG